MLTAKNMKIAGTIITLEVEDKGGLTVDFSLWEDLVFSIGGIFWVICWSFRMIFM